MALHCRWRGLSRGWRRILKAVLLLAILTSLLVYRKQHLAVDEWGWVGSQDSEGREVKKAGDSEDTETGGEDTERGAEDSGTVRFGGAQNDRQTAVVAAFRHAWKVGWVGFSDIQPPDIMSHSVSPSDFIPYRVPATQTLRHTVIPPPQLMATTTLCTLGHFDT